MTEPIPMIIISIIFLGLAYYLYMRKENKGKSGNLQTQNGSGTTFYGKEGYNSLDGSYITTKWFVIFYLPIIPLGTYKVTEGKTEKGLITAGAGIGVGQSTTFQMERIGYFWKQIFKTYFIGFCCLTLFCLIIWVLYLLI